MRPTSSKQRIAIRQQRNQALAIMDAQHRCRFCRRELPAGFLTVFGMDCQERKFCGNDCWASWTERQQFQPLRVS